MRILLSSQDFGFGPTSQMFSFLKHLLISGFSGYIDLKSNYTTQIFYKNFIKTNKYKNIRLVDDYNGEYDKYIGFYDPEIIFEGKRKGKKTIFLCNLTFLWNTKLIEKYKNGFNFSDINFGEIKNHHELILLGYLISDSIFIRNVDSIDKRSIFYKLIKNKTKFIGPIIYPKIYKKNKKDFILVQFGGQVNPISNNEFYLNYFRLVKKILENININKKIIVNPLLEKQAKSIFWEDNVITTLSQDEYQKILSESQVLFAPFGINTFFESSYYNIPTFILPEQHLGHIKSLIKYFGNTKKIIDNSFLLYNLEQYNLNYLDESKFINFLNRNYIELLKKEINIDLKKIINNGFNLINKIGIENYINLDIDIFIKEVLL